MNNLRNHADLITIPNIVRDETFVKKYTVYMYFIIILTSHKQPRWLHHASTASNVRAGTPQSRAVSRGTRQSVAALRQLSSVASQSVSLAPFGDGVSCVSGLFSMCNVVS